MDDLIKYLIGFWTGISLCLLAAPVLKRKMELKLNRDCAERRMKCVVKPETRFEHKKDGKPAIVTLNPCSECRSNAGILDMSVDIVADCDGYIESASSSVRCRCGNFVDGPSASTQEQSIVEAARAWNRHNQQSGSNGKG